MSNYPNFVEFNPWGPPWQHPDEIDTIAEGIWMVSTPSHGGVVLSDERVAKIPEGVSSFTGSPRHWEENCDWAVPALIFLPEFREFWKREGMDPGRMTAIAIATVRHWRTEEERRAILKACDWLNSKEGRPLREEPMTGLTLWDTLGML